MHLNVPRKLIASLVLTAAALFGSAGSAEAANPAASPMGTGNFRRAEVLQAAGHVESSKAYVMGVATAAKYTNAGRLPANARIMAVSHEGRVQLVSAPLDKSQPVTRLTAAQANRMGLITQGQAKKLAERNGGVLGTEGKVRLTAAGLTPAGHSYQFKQTAPLDYTVKQWGEKYVVTGVRRSVTLSGSGESASGAMKYIPAPAKPASP